MIKTPCNFRDLGNIAADGGKAVKPGMLLRSGEPDELKEAEAENFLRKHNISLIIDFRFQDDVPKGSMENFCGVKRVCIDVLKNAADYVPEFKNFQKIDNMNAAHNYMRAIYRTMVLDPYARRGFRAFIETLLIPREGALLFHCFAGKDRTGLAAAILLTALGAHKDDIFKDYMLTNELRLEDNQKILDADRQNGVPETQIGVMNSFLSVRPEYLEEAYNAACELYGGFDAYITEGIGLSADERDALKSIYLF